MPGNIGGVISFKDFSGWEAFVEKMGLRDGIPQIVSAKYLRAQKLLLLSWIDIDIIKAAELVALTALELAVRDRYGQQTKTAYGNMSFAHLLRYMPAYDGLSDDKIPMYHRCGGGAYVGLLTGETDPSLADMRNEGAHGYPFDGFPRSGLLELVRDLIEYAYRDFRP